MSPENRVLSGVRLTEADVQAVLQRAAQYEDSISVDELSSVAAEAGISQAAIAKAVLEVIGERQIAAMMPPAPAVPDPAAALVEEDRGSLGSVLYGVLAGFGGGIIMTSGDEGVAIMSAAILLAGCTFRAFDNRRSGSHRKFQLEMVSCAAGIAAAVAAAFGLEDGAAEAIGGIWATASVVGSMIISSAPTRTLGRFMSRVGRFNRPDELPSDRRGLRTKPALQSQPVI